MDNILYGASSTRDPRVIIVCSAVLGNTFTTPLPHFYRQDPPIGYHSIRVLLNSDFRHEVVLMSDEGAIQPEFLVFYTADLLDKDTSHTTQASDTHSGFSTRVLPAAMVKSIGPPHSPADLPLPDARATESQTPQGSGPPILHTPGRYGGDIVTSPLIRSATLADSDSATLTSSPTSASSSAIASIQDFFISPNSRRSTRLLRFAPREVSRVVVRCLQCLTTLLRDALYIVAVRGQTMSPTWIVSAQIIVLGYPGWSTACVSLLVHTIQPTQWS